MNRVRSATLSLALCAAAGAAVFAWAQGQAPGGSASAKAEMDQPVRTFKAPDLMKSLKEGEPQEKAVVAFPSATAEPGKAGESQAADKKPVVLFFTSSGCSVTWQYEKRIGEFMKKYGDKVRMLGVKSHRFETVDQARKFAEAKNFHFPLLHDTDNAISRYFGVANSPTFVLIDGQGKFRYFGSMDDNPAEAAVKQRFLADAVDAVLAGKEVPVKRTRAYG